MPDRSDPGNRRQPFAMVPEELILGTPDDVCFRLYCYLDLRQGDKGWPVRGIQRVADELGLQRETVAKHLKHLEKLGWVRVARERGTQRKHLAHVVHNPARKERLADEAQHLPERPRRYRQPSKLVGRDPDAVAPPPRERTSDNSGPSGRPVGASARSSHEPPDVRKTNTEELTCGSPHEPQSLSSRSAGEGLVEECDKERVEDLPAVIGTTCRHCHSAPVEAVVFLHGGGEQQLCNEHVRALSERGIVARVVAVDASDGTSFPGDPFLAASVPAPSPAEQVRGLLGRIHPSPRP